MSTRTDIDLHVPPGWDYNPSAWSQRLVIVSLALVGCAIAAYLTLFQYGVIGGMWDPFFGNGAREILTSELSFALPISDAALGALAYLADAMLGVLGGRDRWHRHPWVVVLFAIMVGPLGAISVALVIAQPVAYGEWCTLCMATALISVLMIGPAMDEALATLQHVRAARRDPHRSAWRTFAGRSTRPASTIAVIDATPPSAARQVNLPHQQVSLWPGLPAALLGIWIIVAPAIIGSGDVAATNARIVGPVVVTFGIISMWQVVRAVRLVNLPLGIWLVLAPWILGYGQIDVLNAALVGGALIALSLPRGRHDYRYGGGWTVVFG